MRVFWKANKDIIFFVTGLFTLWRIFLFIPQVLGYFFVDERLRFMGPTPWANFDGVHYLHIAESGYGLYEQAFFPLFPLLIRILGTLLGGNYLLASIFIVHVSCLLGLFLLYKLVKLDFSERVAQWTIVFMLFFPTSFFLVSVYTESLFLALTLGTIYMARKSKWLTAGILGAFATLTRLVGIFLLPALLFEYVLQSKVKNISLLPLRVFSRKALGIFLTPLGLVSYIYFLTITTSDSLAFVHAQPAFGAGRSRGDVILLPQVLYRYFRIFTTVSLSSYSYWIALLEILIFFISVASLYLAYKSGVRRSYIIFSFFSIFIPTLSGTLSSLPRYALSGIAMFIFFATIKSNFFRLTILLIGMMLETILAMLFLRGYFVS